FTVTPRRILPAQVLEESAHDAVMIQGSLSDKLTVDLALKYRMPSLSTQNSAVQAGILMSYGADLTERGHEIARYVDQILKGTMPGDLPVQQPTRYELAINLKTAKALGLTVPPVLLARADMVIEYGRPRCGTVSAPWPLSRTRRSRRTRRL